MDHWFYAIIIKSLILFSYALVVAFVIVAVRKWFPSGKIKAALLSDPTDWMAASTDKLVQKARAKFRRQ